MKNNIFLKLTSFVFASILVLSAFVPMRLSAENEISESFVTSLIKEGSACPEYEITSAVLESISAKSGCDDLAKTYMLTGAPTSKLSSGVQTFENGKYSEGKFVIDHKALAKYITYALKTYSELETNLTEHERTRARSLIAYAFEQLSMNERLNVENAPYWLTGADHSDFYVFEYLENSYITSNNGGYFIAFSPEDLENSENYTRKIRKDKNAYSHGLLFDIFETNELKIAVARDALHFTAVISSDVRDIEKEFKSVRVTAYVTNSDGCEYEFAEYCIYKGYETKIDIPLDGDQSIRFSFSCDADLASLGCVIGDGIFLGDEEESGETLGYSEGKLGDVNRDGILNRVDLNDYADVILGKREADLSVCDTDKNGKVDLGDMLCLENYLVMLANADKEHNKQRSEFFMVTLGDSIARGSGLSNAESFCSSANAYGALISAHIAKQTGYKVKYQNYGIDGIMIADLVLLLENDAEIRESLAKADLITISIGGNDFMADLVNAIEERYGKQYNSVTDAFADIVANEDPVEFLEYLMSVELVDALKEKATLRATELSEFSKRITDINPDAKIMLVTIPNTAVNSDFVIKLDLGGLGGQELPLFNVHELFEKWITPYNELILQSAYMNFEIVDCTDVFNGDHELSLMELDEKIDLLALAGGDLSSVRRFDIHPSAQGHRRIAEAHVKKLTDLVELLKDNYSEETVEKQKYNFSPSPVKNGVELTSAHSITDKQKICYTVRIEDTSDLENLVLSIDYDSALMKLENVSGVSFSGALTSEKEGNFTLVIREKNKMPESISCELVFAGISETDSETAIVANACEARVTVDSMSYQRAEYAEQIEVAAVSDVSNDSEVSEGLLDWFENNGGLFGWIESDKSITQWLAGEGGLFEFVGSNERMSKLIAYTVFALAFVVIGAAVLITLFIAKKKSKLKK